MDETRFFHLINEIWGNCLQKADATDSLFFFFFPSWSLSYFLFVEFSSLFLYISLGTMVKGGGGLEAVTFGEEILN